MTTFQVIVQKSDGSERIVLLNAETAETAMGKVSPGPREAVISAMPDKWFGKAPSAPKPAKRAVENNWVK